MVSKSDCEDTAKGKKCSQQGGFGCQELCVLQHTRVDQSNVETSLGGGGGGGGGGQDYSEAPPVCADCPEPTETDQEVVDFAVSQFYGIEKDNECYTFEVENFQSQVDFGKGKKINKK